MDSALRTMALQGCCIFPTGLGCTVWRKPFGKGEQPGVAGPLQSRIHTSVFGSIFLFPVVLISSTLERQEAALLPPSMVSTFACLPITRV